MLVATIPAASNGFFFLTRVVAVAKAPAAYALHLQGNSSLGSSCTWPPHYVTGLFLLAPGNVENQDRLSR